MKTCFKCGEVLPITEFYVHPEMADGHLGKCKACTRDDSRKKRSETVERVRQYDRLRSRLPHRLAKSRKYQKEHPEVHQRALIAYSDRYPDKSKAHMTTGNAIRDGRLIRKPCAVCGEHPAEAHHDDYSRPLDVRWLCPNHHKEHHRLLRESQRTV